LKLRLDAIEGSDDLGTTDLGATLVDPSCPPA